MHRLAVGKVGATLLEVLLVLVLLAALAPLVLASMANLRDSFRVRQAREDAAALFTRARWTAVSTGSATVALTAEPAMGVVTSRSGDTVAVASFGEMGVSLRLSRDRAGARVRFGPLGLGLVSSQTLRFVAGGKERLLVLSSLGRVSRR